MTDRANLGMATTRELLEELVARTEIDGSALYRTWDGGQDPRNLAVASLQQATAASQRVIDAARHFIMQENPAWNGYRYHAEKSLKEAVAAFDGEG